MKPGWIRSHVPKAHRWDAKAKRRNLDARLAAAKRHFDATIAPYWPEEWSR